MIVYRSKSNGTIKMDWVHCNLCFSQPTENGGYAAKDQRYFLTNCGHVFCENCGCFADGTLDCCKLCNNKCSSTVIGEKSFCKNPQVLEYFQEPVEAGEKLLKVLKFQKAHRINLIRQNNRIQSKYNKLKLYVKKLEHELKIVKNALQNTPTNSYYNKETQSTISIPIFNSTSFDIMDTKSKVQLPISNTKQKFSDMNYRKQSFQNESLESMGTSNRTTSPSVYLSPFLNNSNEKYINKLTKLQLDSFGLQGQFKGNDTTSS